ncbi:DUF4124 domain-containing protein [Halothiobacillus sp.]|uniref:DUF4124 domain-containing protein n=1 Tax=Halothiobacillus sp. TaxID=1891311 RepID=UPI00260923E7|nr:DUF4124 domain-containing protein [Halothiobacillus sp.]
MKIRTGFSSPLPLHQHFRISCFLHVFVVLITIMCTGFVSVAYADLYRWTTKDGMVHLGDNMPSSQAMEGYDLINPSTGEVIRHIDRAKTPQELAVEAAAKKAEEQAAEKKRTEEEAQARHDHMLLDLYSNTSDLERAKSQRLSEIDGLIKQTQNALDRAHERSKHAQTSSEQQAAFQDMLQLSKELFDLQARRNDTVKRFDTDLRRFEQLKTKPSNQAGK